MKRFSRTNPHTEVCKAQGLARGDREILDITNHRHMR